MPVCDNKLHSNSEKENAPMKDNVNVGASESVNAPGDAKEKKAAMKEEEAPEPSFVKLTRRRNSTAKAIIPTSASHSGRVRGYDPFDQTGVRAKHTTLMNFVKANPAYPRRPKNSSIEWYYILRTPKKWLADTHMKVYINVLRLRLSKHLEWFVSNRICFLNSMFATVWRRDYNNFKNSEPNEDGSGKLLPPGAYSYYTGKLPIYCHTKKTWAYEVDHLYSMLHIRGDHWVAIWVSFVARHITIWDSHAGTKHASDTQIDKAVEPLVVMIPYLLQTCVPDEDKWRFPYTPFTHSRVPGMEIPQNIHSGDCGVYCLKYIECHALDLPFPPQLYDKNIRQIREKMAAEIFDEIGVRGHDKLDATGLDIYDRKA
ncbi:uncharacterized protein LOC18008620 [Eutrema salsugineum]|uniref:uncharacterized protein LOC18008620 n=1 Tax=Eutrema salsugineum TaxID=72664 RepID=UPI000CECECCF|nr:uncharacterized protein LOC18008620 [Eutrema salsugineum]